MEKVQTLRQPAPRRLLSLPPQIYYYTDSIYAGAGVQENHVQYVTVGTGAVNVLMTVAAVSPNREVKLCGSMLSLGDFDRCCSTRSSLWRPPGDGCSCSAVLASAVEPVCF